MRELTAAALRGVGAGAAITCSASKPRASKDVRQVGWNISWLRCFLALDSLLYATRREHLFHAACGEGWMRSGDYALRPVCVSLDCFTDNHSPRIGRLALNLISDIIKALLCEETPDVVIPDPQCAVDSY